MTTATIERSVRLPPDAHAEECDSCAETLAMFPAPKGNNRIGSAPLTSGDLVALHLALGNKWAAAVERSAAYLMDGWSDRLLSETARRVLAKPLPKRG